VIFFILTGLVGLGLVGFGIWMLTLPGQLAAASQSTATALVTRSLDEPAAIIITATLDGANTPQPGHQNGGNGTAGTLPAATAAAVITPPPGGSGAWDACPGSYQSFLRVGQKAMVSLNPPLPNNVRAAASKSAKFLFAIQPGDEVDIIDGPGCENSWVWWKVQAKDGQSGWTAEGDGTEYWIVPVN